jgi:hypothetical protein
MLGTAGKLAGKAAAAGTSIAMTGKGLYDFFSDDKMRDTGVGGLMESLGGTGMKILDFATFGLTKKLTEMANITIPGMDTDDIADARAIFHSSGRDPDNSRMPIRTDNYQLISDILNNQQAYPDHIVAAAKKVNPEDIKPVELALGGIVTKATNAIVGEAGSEAVIPLREFYAKMDELINVVRQGGDVYMDGNKVGESLMLASTKLS